MDTQRANASGMSLVQTYEVLCQARGLDADPFAFLAAHGAVPFDEFMAVLGFDQQWRWGSQQGRSAEDYFQNLPLAYQNRQARLQLIEWETAARRNTGDAPTLAELERRFPDVREVLPGLLTAARSAADSSPPAPASDRLNHVNKSAQPTHRTSADSLSTLPPPADSPSPAVSPPPVPSLSPPPHERATPQPDFDPLGVVGKSFNARYEVTGYLGSGSFGHVYRGRDGRFDRGDDSALVAIKFMQTSLINKSSFEREAQLMRRFQHPHFVVVYDYGNDATGLSWLVMEYLPGETLDQVLQAVAGPAPGPLVIQFAEQVLGALHSAHRKNLIHRDLKPANIMVMPDGDQGEVCFKILDFGLSSQLDASSSLANRTMNGAGTPTFMAPEQITTGLATPRSDLYSVGVMLFWMLSGRMPFEMVSVPKALYDAVHTPAPALSSVLPPKAVSPALDQLIARCLAKDPTARPPDLLVVRDGLLDALRSSKIKDSAKPTGATAAPPRPATARRRRAVAVVALVGAFAMAAAGLYPVVFDAWKPTPTPTSAPAPQVPQAPAPASPPLVATSEPTSPAPSNDPINAAAQSETPKLAPSPAAVATTTGDSADRPDASSPVNPPPPVGVTLQDPLPNDPKVPMPAPPPQVVATNIPPPPPSSDGLIRGLIKAARATNIPPPPPPPPTFAGARAGDRKLLTDRQTAFRWCPAGSFTMGSPKSEAGHDNDEDQVSVTLSRGFWLQETEVTQGEWQAVMGTTPWKGKDYVKEGDPYPATYVSHGGDAKSPEADSALAYCQKLTTRERAAGRLPAGWEYRLPTEAEWEYACRAGTTTTYSFGRDSAALAQHAWFDKNAWDVGEKYAHAVGLKQPNAWGLRDMHGNVWEWCGDVYKLTGGADPFVTSGGAFRVFRGGSWYFTPADCRSANRDGCSPGFRSGDLGFRPLAVLSR